MRGQVLQADAGGGLILGEDGNRYRFATGEWKGTIAPAAGTPVDYLVDGGSAREVFPILPPGTTVPPAERGNSELLGSLGIGCLILSLFFHLLPLIGALILGLVGASNAKAHNNRTGLVLSRIAWIGALVLMALLVALIAFGMSLAIPFFREFFEVMHGFAYHRGTIT